MKLKYINRKLLEKYDIKESNNSSINNKIVYRVCNSDEIDKILVLSDFSKIGKKFPQNLRCNNHIYDKDEFYMHFFKERRDVLRLFNLANCYLCSYSNPESILDSSKGEGWYPNHLGYDKEDAVIEYAIKSKELDINNLISIDKIKFKIYFYDSIYDIKIDDFLERLYEKEHNKILVKK